LGAGMADATSVVEYLSTRRWFRESTHARNQRWIRDAMSWRRAMKVGLGWVGVIAEAGGSGCTGLVSTTARPALMGPGGLMGRA
jgi:hypothetical protein